MQNDIDMLRMAAAKLKKEDPQGYLLFKQELCAEVQVIDVMHDIKKIALVVGHRAGAQGAVNTDGISEYAYWKKYLEKHITHFADITGHEFKIFYREDRDGNSYTERMKKLAGRINDWGADIALSFHFNAADNQNAEGFEILYSGSKTSYAYAGKLSRLFERHLYGDNRGLLIREKNEDGGGFLHRTRMPALLIEPYFGSSKKDTDTFNTHIDSFTDALISFFETL